MVYFSDYPEFRPNLTPLQVIKKGAFGGTYFRPIKSSVVNKNLKNIHKEYSFFDKVSENILTRPWKDYDSKINKYSVKVGTTLEFWESSGWISSYHPYGWFHWYCDFYSGKRCPDDERQIKRWLNTAGPSSRFRRNLINQIKRKESTYDDFSISPKIRQTLLHWGYELIESDLS